MKKNTKVIIMTAKAANGNDLTYRTICPQNSSSGVSPSFRM